MAGVQVTIDGVIWDKHLKAGRPVTIIGEAILTGLGVGGGPIMPPEGGGGGGAPDHIWGGGNVPMPTPPIANVPGAPGYPGGGKPPGIWGGPIDPYPGHPLPEPPGKPEEPVQPPIEWKAVWHPTAGWVVVGIPTIEHPVPSK